MINTNTLQLRKFAQECVDHYATCDKVDDFYTLEVSDLPCFARHEFAALIMSHDLSYASEATGPDNPLWESKMLPALMNHLKNSTDTDESIEFQKIWRDCVTSYMQNHMQELIDNSLSDINSDHGLTRSPSQTYGVSLHGPL